MKTTILFIATLFCINAFSQDYKLDTNIGYYTDTYHDEYRNERCLLDIYYPTNIEDFPTVVFFHGGGLEGGEKYIPEILKNKGIAVIAPNYRLSPKANHPSYINDAAQAVAWAKNNIHKYGGSNKIYVSGHSAGGYLTLMLALDKKYLNAVDVDADSLAGYVPLTGQTNTHYTIRKERGLNPTIPIIDEFAPLYHSRKLTAPMILITGDRNKELLARYTENLHLQDILTECGNKIPLYELKGFDHGTMEAPGCLLLLELIKENK